MTLLDAKPLLKAQRSKCTSWSRCSVYLLHRWMRIACEVLWKSKREVTDLNHVLDSTVRVLLDDGLDPDERLHLEQTFANVRRSAQQAAAFYRKWQWDIVAPLVDNVGKCTPGNSPHVRFQYDTIQYNWMLCERLAWKHNLTDIMDAEDE